MGVTQVTTEGTASYARMAKVIRYVDENFREQPDLAELASVAGLSPAHFSREFARWAGLPPTRYVKRLALLAAQGSLTRGESVIAAAWEAGLSGPGRLHDLFVSFEAVTPGEYKTGGAGLELAHGFATTPFGTGHFAATGRGLAWLAFVDAGERNAIEELAARMPGARLTRDDASAGRVAEQVFGQRRGRLALDVRGTNFQVRVWEALLKLGANAALDYGQIARAIGQAGASRAVGQAVARNPVAFLIPCHRVLRRDGALGGYRWGVDRKRAMLAWETAQASGA